MSTTTDDALIAHIEDGCTGHAATCTAHAPDNRLAGGRGYVDRQWLRGTRPLIALPPPLPAMPSQAINRLPLLDADHAPLTHCERVATILRAVLIAPVAIAAFWLWAVLMMGGCTDANPCFDRCAQACVASGETPRPSGNTALQCDCNCPMPEGR